LNHHYYGASPELGKCILKAAILPTISYPPQEDFTHRISYAALKQNLPDMFALTVTYLGNPINGLQIARLFCTEQ